MPDIIVLTERDLRTCVSLNRRVIDTISEAFAALVEKPVVMPPVLSMDLPEVNGEVDIKTAYVPGFDGFAIKVSPGFFNNPALGLASLNGLMVVLSAQTGIVQAVLLDNGYLTDIRTAAAGGVVARYLAPRRVETAGIIGAGVQAGLQARALLLEREVGRVLVWNRNLSRAEQFAAEQSALLGVPVQVAQDLRALVEASQVVVTTTPAREPLISAKWLHPGLHITAMGSDSPLKNELDPEIPMRVDRLVVDHTQQSIERGELRAAAEAGWVPAESVIDELGLICAGRREGRSSEQQITLCDLTGTGVQDTAIASYALAQVGNKEVGMLIHS